MDISDIFAVYEREKRMKNKLEPLEEQFYKRVSDIIKRYKRFLELGEEDEEHKRLKLELENLKELIKQIVNIRLEKLINLALFEAKENIKIAERNDMTREERILFDVVSALLRGYYKHVLENIFLGEPPEINKLFEDVKPLMEKRTKRINKVLVIFTKEFSQIVGPDGKIYGPFNPEEIYTLPKEIAKRMLSLNICEEIKMRKG
ncbi:MAG TPA: hypothetical protein EYH09_01160 [Candidatus Nanopusillus sp.]|nr:hypothetical protein [Candidatus Nanopusillus sp.]